MNALLSHVWGVSGAQDRVWAQVTGLPPRIAVGRLLMVFQAFIDESHTEAATYVLGGYVADAETWAKFAKDWEELLPYAPFSKSGKRRFKMKDMMKSEERIGHVPAFYRVIEKYKLFSLSCKIDMAELDRAKRRIWVENLKIDWDYADNPYSMTFRCLMDMFHTNRELLNDIFPPGNKIDFIFDKRGESRAILAMWNDYIKERPDETRQYYGANPRFEDDEDFVALQAADYWAWWVRKWYEEGTPEKIETQDFGKWKATEQPLGLKISFDEDQIAEFFLSYIRERIEPGRPIYDLKFSRPASK